MKKLLCLALTIAMALSFAVLPASADGVSATLAVTGDNGAVDDIITVTYTITGTSTIYAWQGAFTYDHTAMVPVDTNNATIKYKTNGEATTANAKKALISSTLADTFGADEYEGDYEDTGIWGQTGVKASYNGSVGSFTVYASAAGSDADGNAAIVSSTGYTAFSVRFKRISKGEINVAFDTTVVPKVEATNLSGNVVTSSKVDYTAPTTGGGETTTDKWEAATSTDMPSAWTAPDALDGEVRRVTVFGKNATSKALAANSYGVTFGDNTYYGVATDTAVQYWAIVIVDTEGNKITSGNTYNGTAFVGTETWSVSVSAD